MIDVVPPDILKEFPVFELVLLIALSLLSLLLLGRAAGTRELSPAGLGRSVARGTRVLTGTGSSMRPVEHLRG
ncbi:MULTISPECIES: hypothetical protein [unclassified Ornithinimicrobium]|uniref:hypothetical protein n=1 Tax=unclassified Ornithinimicrobium TaxID=2615080 RepID=UPI003854892A